MFETILAAIVASNWREVRDSSDFKSEQRQFVFLDGFRQIKGFRAWGQDDPNLAKRDFPFWKRRNKRQH
jgi:hypothetical protein